MPFPNTDWPGSLDSEQDRTDLIDIVYANDFDYPDRQIRQIQEWLGVTGELIGAGIADAGAGGLVSPIADSGVSFQFVARDAFTSGKLLSVGDNYDAAPPAYTEKFSVDFQGVLGLNPIAVLPSAGTEGRVLYKSGAGAGLYIDNGATWTAVASGALSLPYVQNIFFVDTISGGSYTEDGTIQYPYNAIQDAIDAASSGDAVFVLPGTYDEQITMKDGVNVVGIDRDKVVISNSSGPVLQFTGTTNATLANVSVTTSSGVTCILGNCAGTCRLQNVFAENSAGGASTVDLDATAFWAVERCEFKSQIASSDPTDISLKIQNENANWFDNCRFADGRVVMTFASASAEKTIFNNCYFVGTGASQAEGCGLHVNHADVKVQLQGCYFRCGGTGFCISISVDADVWVENCHFKSEGGAVNAGIYFSSDCTFTLLDSYFENIGTNYGDLHADNVIVTDAIVRGNRFQNGMWGNGAGVIRITDPVKNVGGEFDFYIDTNYALYSIASGEQAIVRLHEDIATASTLPTVDVVGSVVIDGQGQFTLSRTTAGGVFSLDSGNWTFKDITITSAQADAVYISSGAGHTKMFGTTIVTTGNYNPLVISSETGAEIVNCTFISSVPGAASYVDVSCDASGAGDSLDFDDVDTVTLDDSGASFHEDMVGHRITISGASPAANNGTFPITAVNSSTQLEFTNTGGVDEATSSLTYTIDSSSVEFKDCAFISYDVSQAILVKGNDGTLEAEGCRFEGGVVLTSGGSATLSKFNDCYFTEDSSGCVLIQTNANQVAEFYNCLFQGDNVPGIYATVDCSVIALGNRFELLSGTSPDISGSVDFGPNVIKGNAMTVGMEDHVFTDEPRKRVGAGAGTDFYMDIEAAVAAVENGDTLVLYESVTVPSTITVPANSFIIDGQRQFSVTHASGAGNSVFSLATTGATLTLSNMAVGKLAISSDASKLYLDRVDVSGMIDITGGNSGTTVSMNDTKVVGDDTDGYCLQFGDADPLVYAFNSYLKGYTATSAVHWNSVTNNNLRAFATAFMNGSLGSNDPFDETGTVTPDFKASQCRFNTEPATGTWTNNIDPGQRSNTYDPDSDYFWR